MPIADVSSVRVGSPLALLVKSHSIVSVTTSGDESGQRTEQRLDDIVRDADEYYESLSQKHVSKTSLDVIVVSLVVWFASFAVIGLSAFALYGRTIYYILVAS